MKESTTGKHLCVSGCVCVYACVHVYVCAHVDDIVRVPFTVFEFRRTRDYNGNINLEQRRETRNGTVRIKHTKRKFTDAGGRLDGSGVGAGELATRVYTHTC